jgi:glycosyltransferase involved in cell wall biosynthesis
MKVSIVITNFNYGRYIGRAIQSCLAQKFIDNDYEIIVVDDCSTDNSRPILESWKEDAKVIYHDKRYGLPTAINTGIKASKGAYVIRLDADDWFDRHICFILSYFLDHNKEIGFVWPDYFVYDEHENVVGRISNPQGGGVMFRKHLLMDLGLYDEQMLIHEDKDILLRCEELYPGYHLKMPLYRYYRHDHNITNQTDQMKGYRERLIKKHGTDECRADSFLNPGYLSSKKELDSK